MLSYLLRQLINSCGIFLRTIRAFFTRKAAGAVAGVRRAANFSRKATKVATASFQGAVAAMKKPTKREDYIETQHLLISKSFLILALVQLVLLGLLIYYIIWPFVLSRFLTARFYIQDSRLESWSGKVIVCSDEAKKIPLLSGTLSDGLLQGNGKEYDENGLLLYEGGFADGQRSGTGRLYEAGSLVYEGDFSAGEPQGTGTAYDPDDGRIIYKGDFADGLYEGSGSFYTKDGDVIRADFISGRTDGNIRWYISGHLWYEGSADNLTPNGEGKIYSSDGRVIYTGRFSNGMLDGDWLLECTAEELREAFGTENITEEDGEQGFVITNRELGVTVLCSYRQGEQEAQAYEVDFEPEGDMTRLLPMSDNGDTQTRQIWSREGSTPVTENTENTNKADAQGSLEAMLTEITSGGSNTGDAEKLLGRVSDAQDAQTLATAMVDWFVGNESAKLKDKNHELLTAERDALQKQLEHGEGSEKNITAIDERITALEREQLQYEDRRERAAIEIARLTGQQVQSPSLAGALILFNPSETNETALYNAAKAYAGDEADAAALQAECKTAILDLKLLYAEVETARDTVDKASEQTGSVTAAYAKGTVTDSDLTEAQVAQNEAYAALLEALGNFTSRVAEINTLCGGWLAKQYSWMQSSFAAIFSK